MKATLNHTKGTIVLPTVKLDAKGQIIIPVKTIKRFGLKPGEKLKLVENEKAIVLVPDKKIPKDQRWYHTKTWQKMMQDAFEDVKRGRMLGPFDSVQEFKQAIKTRTRA